MTGVTDVADFLMPVVLTEAWVDILGGSDSLPEANPVCLLSHQPETQV